MSGPSGLAAATSPRRDASKRFALVFDPFSDVGHARASRAAGRPVRWAALPISSATLPTATIAASASRAALPATAVGSASGRAASSSSRTGPAAAAEDAWHHCRRRCDDSRTRVALPQPTHRRPGHPARETRAQARQVAAAPLRLPPAVPPPMLHLRGGGFLRGRERRPAYCTSAQAPALPVHSLHAKRVDGRKCAAANGECMDAVRADTR